MCVLIFFTILSETFHALRRTDRDIMNNVYWFSWKIPFILFKDLMKLEFSRDFRKYWSI